jgi:Fe-Mn family superoxide dismutase
MPNSAVNHELFWNMMAPPATGGNTTTPGVGGVARPDLGIVRAVTARWGSVEAFQRAFTDAAMGIFGSGWAWLTLDVPADVPAALLSGDPAAAAALLNITTTANQDTPASTPGRVPLLALDIWEHAFVIKYGHVRASYIAAWWNVANWEYADGRLNAAMRQLGGGGGRTAGAGHGDGEL